MSKTFTNNLKKAREQAGMTQQELAEKVGVSVQAVQNYEYGKRDLKWSTLVHLAEAVDASPSYIMGLEQEPSAVELVIDAYEDVPVYGSIAAGVPIEMIPVDKRHPCPVAIRRKWPNGFYTTVKGESMNRSLPNGSLAYVVPCTSVDYDGQPYAVAVNGNEATIKRVHRLENGFELIPDSYDPTFRPRMYDNGNPTDETVTIIGRVVWFTIPFNWTF